jgi:hypothetical protein
VSVHQTTVRSCQYIQLQCARVSTSNYSALVSVHPTTVRSCQYIQLQDPLPLNPRTDNQYVRYTATVAVPDLPQRNNKPNIFDLPSGTERKDKRKVARVADRRALQTNRTSGGKFQPFRIFALEGSK